MDILNKIFMIYLCFINFITFLVYFIDKRSAIKYRYRISEARLLALAAMGGAFLAHLAMFIFRHKTKHIKFRLLVPLFEIIWLVIIYLLVFNKSFLLN